MNEQLPLYEDDKSQGHEDIPELPYDILRTLSVIHTLAANRATEDMRRRGAFDVPQAQLPEELPNTDN